MTALQKLRDEKVTIFDLTESNPTRCQFKYPQDKILSALASVKNLAYEPNPRGSLAAREAIAKYYQAKKFDVSPEEIFLTSSTSEGYSYLFRLLADVDDEVLFPQPSYPLFQYLVDLNDLKINFYPLTYADSWHMNLEQLDGQINSKTKAIVVVNPNNPTGSFIKKSELKQLSAICKQRNIPIIADEVFYDFGFDDSPEESLVNNHEVLTFVLGGVSKTLALPQMKLSWIIVKGPKELVKAANERLEIIADTYLSVNAPTQNAFSEWLLLKDEIQNEVRERLKRNYDFIKKEVAQSKSCQLLKTEGGWYAVLRLPDDIDEEDFVLQLLREDHVFVHPGYFFDFEEGAHLVLSLLAPFDIFCDGVKRLVNRI